jgi:hypothetical protein
MDMHYRRRQTCGLQFWLVRFTTETNLSPVFPPSFLIGKCAFFILLSCFVIAWSHKGKFELRVLALSWFVFWTSIDRSGTCASHYVMVWADLWRCFKGFPRRSSKMEHFVCMVHWFFLFVCLLLRFCRLRFGHPSLRRYLLTCIQFVNIYESAPNVFGYTVSSAVHQSMSDCVRA